MEVVHISSQAPQSALQIVSYALQDSSEIGRENPYCTVGEMDVLRACDEHKIIQKI